MGLEAIFFSRADLRDKERRKADKEMEWIWRPMFNHLGKKGQIFAHTMVDFYCPPNYFGFDQRDDTDNDTAFIDNPEFDTFNADWKTEAFMEVINEYISIYRTNHILIPMGCDFHFANAHQNYKSMDKMIRYINNKHPNVTLMYSTPSEYLDAVNEADIEWPTRYDDMFPYSTGIDNFWTGYYSNRPSGKKYVRDGSANSLASNKLYALEVLSETNTTDPDKLLNASNSMLDALGIFQHHDAITGTSKQFVADDYVDRLHKAMNINNQVYREQVKKIIELNYGFTLDDI